MGGRIKWLSTEEVTALEKQMDVVEAEFKKVGDAIDGRVPARMIDKWLDLDRKMHSFKVTVLDALWPEAARSLSRGDR